MERNYVTVTLCIVYSVYTILIFVVAWFFKALSACLLFIAADSTAASWDGGHRSANKRRLIESRRPTVSRPSHCNGD